MLGAFCDLYNAGLQQRIEACRRRGISLRSVDQAHELKPVRATDERLALYSYSAEQQVLRRLDKAFKAFFRRLKERQGKAGFPRFQSKSRFDGAEFRVGDGLTIRKTSRSARQSAWAPSASLARSRSSGIARCPKAQRSEPPFCPVPTANGSSASRSKSRRLPPSVPCPQSASTWACPASWPSRRARRSLPHSGRSAPPRACAVASGRWLASAGSPPGGAKPSAPSPGIKPRSRRAVATSCTSSRAGSCGSTRTSPWKTSPCGGLAGTRLAKAVHNAAWAQLTAMLSDKAANA